MGLVASDASRCRWGIGWPNLTRNAAPDVVGRLEHAGYLRRAGGWGPWRPGRWVPVNADWEFAPVARVRAALDATRPLSVPGAVLVDACGLEFRTLVYGALADAGISDLGAGDPMRWVAEPAS